MNIYKFSNIYNKSFYENFYKILKSVLMIFKKEGENCTNKFKKKKVKICKKKRLKIALINLKKIEGENW